MAANKFATMIHRKTNKITLVLVYAILEWLLILLLLLNSIFSYLIFKFADYFGLKPPCLWCSRIDHLLDPSKKANYYRDLLCDDHAMEISNLGFCCSHRKVAESRDMCEDCSSSAEFSKEFAYFPWMKQIGLVQDGLEDKAIKDGEVDFKCCSCCGVIIENIIFSPCLLVEPDWGVFDYTHKAKSFKEAEVDEGIRIPSDQIRSDSVFYHQEDEQESEENIGSAAYNNTQEIYTVKEEEADDKIDEGTQIPFYQQEDEHKNEENEGIQTVSEIEDETEEEFSCFISSFDCNKEAIDKNEEDKADLFMQEKKEETKDIELTVKMDGLRPCSDEAPEVVSKHLEFYIDGQDCHLIPVEFYKSGEEDQQGLCDDNGDVILDFNVQVGAQACSFVEKKHFSEETVTLVSSSDESKQEDDQTATVKASEEMGSHDRQVQGSSDDLFQMQNDEEADAEVSIGTEIPDHEQIDDVPSQEITPEDDDHGSDQVEEMLEFKIVAIEDEKPVINTGIHFPPALHEMEDEKFPETPNSVDSLHDLNKRFLLLERKESGTEDSLDSISVTSEIECPDGVLTIEKLKSALREERKVLNTLYTELEEERSASAVAANQTMAMINRLQEEKAAMQMEALQYQRMMEEQSEYDQEALQLLNELMVKREKEKVELEKELEVYRKKVEEYEAKEKTEVFRRRRRESSGSCTNTEDSERLSSIDLNQETKEDDKDKDKVCNFDDYDGVAEHKNTPVDAVLCLQESLADFEEERLSILEQLKVLEEKLFTLKDEEGEEENFEDVKPIENGNGHIGENGNGHFHMKEINGKHKLLKSKRLLPLFDAVEAETENGLSSNGTHHENGMNHSENSSVAKFEGVNNRIATEEEVEELYERLQALEADREFLRRCISSLSKGDKGVYLLQEILQHLRDLRNVELRVRNMGDSGL